MFVELFTRKKFPTLVEGGGVVASGRLAAVDGAAAGVQRVLGGGQDLELQRSLGEVHRQTRDQRRF